MSTNPGAIRTATLIAAGVCLLGWCAGARAADAPPHLEHLTTSDGLPQGTVFATLQDSQGFVWLATEDGLVRYDGHELFRYAYSRNARGGLPRNYIQTIVEDRHHDLWIAVKEEAWHAGNARPTASPSTATIPTMPARSPATPCTPCWWMPAIVSGSEPPTRVSTFSTRLRGASSTCVMIPTIRTRSATTGFSHWRSTARGAVVGTEVGLDRWQPEQRAFIHHRHEPGNPRSLSGNQVSRVLEDQSGALWVGTFDGGLDRMDREGQVTEVFRHDAARAGSLASDDVRAILEDQAGHLWVGTAGGLDMLKRPRASSSTTGTTRAMPARCATPSSCRCTRMQPAWCGSARAPAVSAAGIPAAGSSAVTARSGWGQAGDGICGRPQQQGLDRLARRRPHLVRR